MENRLSYLKGLEVLDPLERKVLEFVVNDCNQWNLFVGTPGVYKDCLFKLGLKKPELNFMLKRLCNWNYIALVRGASYAVNPLIVYELKNKPYGETFIKEVEYYLSVSNLKKDRFILY